MLLSEMTMAEFEAGLKLTRTVLLPFGSVEQHGPHLPLSTDTFQAYDVGNRAAEAIPLFVAPPVHYGVCRSTSCHSGTISISTGTLKAILIDIVRSLTAQGFINFIVLSGHAGGTHQMALVDAGEMLLREFKEISIAIVSEYGVVRKVAGHLVETDHDSHAGEIETSRMMHSHPDLVKGIGSPEIPNFPEYLLVRNKKEYWPGGVWGDPRKASASKGKQIEDLVVSEIVELVRRLDSRLAVS